MSQTEKRGEGRVKMKMGQSGSALLLETLQDREETQSEAQRFRDNVG